MNAKASYFIELYKKGHTLNQCETISGYNKGLIYLRHNKEIRELTSLRLKEKHDRYHNRLLVEKQKRQENRHKKNREKLEMYASVIECFVSDPNQSFLDIASKFNISITTVKNIIDLYIPVKFGEVITLQSKIND